MRKLLLTLAVMLAVATSAHAVGGIDISVNACPGNPGAIGATYSMDCASGAGIVILGTWAPAENIAELTSMDGTIDLYVPDGLETIGFWDFDATGCNPNALSSDHARPTGFVTPVSYTATWLAAGSGSAIAGFYPTGVRGKNMRISFTCYRGALLDVTA